ncbi:MAG: tRNA guanosine(34) transglycosylase Tgt [Candidatus Dojkabacteria bacterium]|jgi:queuine tRNA-ribosyltransferase
MELKDFGKNFVFMPDATRGAVRSLTTEQLKETGTEAIVTNTLHLMMNPGEENIKKLGGIKKFMNWGGIVLTDSGGFQVFSLIHSQKWKGTVHENGATFKSPTTGDLYELTPEKSIDMQMAINSDVLVTLDDCRQAILERDEAEMSVRRTIDWAKRCRKHFDEVYGGTKETGKLLSCVVQGANYLDLRKKCAEELSEIGFDGYNFGGFVVTEGGELVLEEMRAVVENTSQDKFKYAMGVGKPEDIRIVAELGYKVFDTVLVTRNARHGTLYSDDMEDGILRIKNAEYALDEKPIDSGCDCYTCQRHSRAYVHHLIRVNEITGLVLATIHNLRYYQRIIEDLNR